MKTLTFWRGTEKEKTAEKTCRQRRNRSSPKGVLCHPVTSCVKSGSVGEAKIFRGKESFIGGEIVLP